LARREVGSLKRVGVGFPPIKKAPRRGALKSDIWWARRKAGRMTGLVIFHEGFFTLLANRRQGDDGDQEERQNQQRGRQRTGSEGCEVSPRQQQGAAEVLFHH